MESDFVSGCVRLDVSVDYLDDWARCLDALASGEGVEWPPDGRTAWLDIVPDDPVEVTVHEAPSTQVAVRVPIDVAENCGGEPPAARRRMPGPGLNRRAEGRTGPCRRFDHAVTLRSRPRSQKEVGTVSQPTLMCSHPVPRAPRI
ncbi:DUF5959 family protein [Streptomyces sp. PA03-1a]|nr:DUF5959 family protein [Streptomyces sp. PA03-1a]MDX2812787.1 DUF5959 family protein [Streptomyces sp. PA03-5A]